MKYFASYQVRDDYWSKHPFGVRVVGDDGSVLKEIYGLDDYEMCKYHIDKLRREGYEIAAAVGTDYIDDAQWHRICLLRTAKKPVSEESEGPEVTENDTETVTEGETENETENETEGETVGETKMAEDREPASEEEEAE